MKKMYAYVIGRCPVSGIETVERKEMTAPNWSLYANNAKYRHDNPNWNQIIKAEVNQRQNALKTQIRVV